MSRHWPPDWTVIDGYGAEPKARGGVVLLVLVAVFVGLLGGAAWLRWNAPPVDTGPSGPIEWNEVQAVPTRAPDAQDVAWEKKARASPVIASDSDAIQTGLPRASGARNDDLGREVSGQRIRVIDGDTFDLNGTRIRVAGIDAPETHPPRCANEAQLGLAATQKLAELLRSGPLWISGLVTDRYGRSVRTVRVNGEDVADAMISAGLARNYDGKQRQGWC
jgi:endonuclease YncB( thermonuclease family)